MTRRKSAFLAIALSLGLVLAACGDDPTVDSADDESGETTDEAGGGFTVTLSADAIEMPDEVAGGVIEVTIKSDLEEADVNFSKVPDGATDADFRAAIASATTGGPIPEIIEATTGVTGKSQTIELPEGSYIAWADPQSGEEGGEGEEGSPPAAEGEEAAQGEEVEGDEADPSAFVTKAFTVTAGEDGELPDTGSSITARDYSFDIDVEAGGEKFTFRNEGPDQVHHVVLLNFGTVAPDDVEANLEAFLQSEGEGEQPEAFKDLDQSKLFGTGESTVVTPGLGVTADASFEAGTYAAVCFLQDRAGGPPHVFGKGMRTVFTVD